MKPDYDFRIIQREAGALPEEQRRRLAERPFAKVSSSLKERAAHFEPSEELENAINTAIAVGQPLLLTGEPGCGKTQAAHYVAKQLGVELFQFHAKSESLAVDLLYHFDQVAYFRDANTRPEMLAGKVVEKATYIEPRALWEAFDYAKKHGHPAVVLIDEIDKAPRDFPNDLLHELDQMQFTVKETRRRVDCDAALRPIVLMTSNGERRLPEPFLRRCVYHHIEFDVALLRRAVGLHKPEAGRYLGFSDEFLNVAIQRLQELRDKAQGRPPSTGEFLVWLQALSVAVGDHPKALEEKDVHDLPCLSALRKQGEDR